MNRTHLGVLAMIFGGLLGLASYGLPPAQQSFHPGGEPFTPTRMDWLIIELQACCRHDGLPVDGFDLQFASPDPETVLIYVTYLPSVDRDAMNVTVDSAKKIIGIKARIYGWQNWVKVKEDVHMGSTPNNS